MKIYGNENRQVHFLEQKTSRIQKHAAWLVKPQSKTKEIFKKVLYNIEIMLLGYSLFGMKTAQNLTKSVNSELFKKAIANKKSPDLNYHVMTKSATETFNHAQEFMLKDGVIWERKIDSDEPWKAIYFDGVEPQEISADGANLVVMDKDRAIHYKKVLLEFRGNELKGKMKESEENYWVSDISDKNNWRSKWFRLPIISSFYNLKNGKRLKLPSCRAWSISHRGRFNDYVEYHGKRDRAMNGVTTLYALEEDGKRIRKFDPWSPTYSEQFAFFPETENLSFEALNLKASGSTMMLIGYERQRGSDKEQLVIKTKLADIDTEGWNPALKYTYFAEEEVEGKVLGIPGENWMTHLLTLSEGETITSEITIAQTGKGNKERVLSVIGTKWVGDELQTGRYYKKIDDKEWSFSDDPTLKDPKEVLPLERIAEAPFKSSMRSYKAQLEGNMSYKPLAKNRRKFKGSIEINGFGDNGQVSPVRIKIGKEEFQLQLIKRKRLKHFLGVKGWHHHLVIPKEHQGNPLLEKFLGTKSKVISVAIAENQGNILASFGRFRISMNLSDPDS